MRCPNLGTHFSKKGTMANKAKSSFSIKGKTYEFTVTKYTGIMGKLWTVDEAILAPAELERLVIEKCGVIREIKTPKKQPK